MLCSHRWVLFSGMKKDEPGVGVLKLVLLPGMDGTGELLTDFIDSLCGIFETDTVRYPTDSFLSYSELARFVRSSTPVSHPFVLVAESFSTPLAIQCAATNPPNLKGLVICAGFATSPIRGYRRFLGSLLTPILFRVVLPELAAKLWLVGPDAPPSLLAAVRGAISSVQPKVLAARLRAALACDARAELGHVVVPILYLQAKQDRLVSALCLEDIQQIKPQTAVAIIDGPHLLLQRQPKRAAEVVSEFVQQLL
jgi:pimeloyl-[acyl-carrier protein] methyl ester esterase